MRPSGDSGVSDEQHFTEYVAARHHALVRTAYLLTGDRHDAEDLVQTALMKAVPRWSRIRGNPEPYVRTALYNESISRWRRRSSRQSRERLTDVVPERRLEAGDPGDRVVLADALARLTPKQRAVLVLRYYEDLTEVQTAAALGVSVGTVKSQTKHALERLRVLAPELPDLVG